MWPYSMYKTYNACVHAFIYRENATRSQGYCVKWLHLSVKDQPMTFRTGRLDASTHMNNNERFGGKYGEKREEEEQSFATEIKAEIEDVGEQSESSI